MPPPFEARKTFSFQAPTMLSSESPTAFRKQLIGSPRPAPPLESTGVEPISQSLEM